MNWAHWHMILVHFPIAGCVLALGLLVLVQLSKNPAVHKLSYAFLFVITLSAFPAAISGGPSQEHLELTAELKPYIDRHAMIALFATWALQFTGFLALINLIFLYRRGKVPAVTYWLILCSLIGATYMMAWCASLGGEIVHHEIRGHQILPVPELSGLE